MFRHKEKLKNIVQYCSENNLSYEEVVRMVAEECADLCLRHSNEMDIHGFKSKADTANTCAGIIRETYDLKKVYR